MERGFRDDGGAAAEGRGAGRAARCPAGAICALQHPENRTNTPSGASECAPSPFFRRLSPRCPLGWPTPPIRIPPPPRQPSGAAPFRGLAPGRGRDGLGSRVRNLAPRTLPVPAAPRRGTSARQSRCLDVLRPAGGPLQDPWPLCPPPWGGTGPLYALRPPTTTLRLTPTSGISKTRFRPGAAGRKCSNCRSAHRSSQALERLRGGWTWCSSTDAPGVTVPGTWRRRIFPFPRTPQVGAAEPRPSWLAGGVAET